MGIVLAIENDYRYFGAMGELQEMWQLHKPERGRGVQNVRSLSNAECWKEGSRMET